MKVDLAYERDDNDDAVPSNDHRTAPILYVNGHLVPPDVASRARPNQMLLDFLRTELRLSGTKLGCGEGGCGACTVLVSSRGGGTGTGGTNKKIVHAAVNACLYPVLAADGKHVTTVEGVGSWKTRGGGRADGDDGDDDGLHPIQRALADGHGSQCGFCTPGIVMALYGLLSSGGGGEDDDGDNPPPVEVVEEHMDGNLCRCTGYRPIWDAARALCGGGGGGAGMDVEDLAVTVAGGAGGPDGPCGTPCRECPGRDACEEKCNVDDQEAVVVATNPSSSSNYSSSSMVVCTTESNVRDLEAKRSDFEKKWWKQPYDMFPRDLLLLLPTADEEKEDGGETSTPLREVLARTLVVTDASIHDGGTWHQPTTFEGLLDLHRLYGAGIKMVVGNTEVGIETKFKKLSYPRLVHPAESIRNLYEIFVANGHLVVGGCASLSDLQSFCHRLMIEDNIGGGDDANNMSRTARPTHDMLRWFASTQIRNVACLGGNLATASPISDMNPLLCCHSAIVVLASRPKTDGGIRRRRVPVSDFFLGYRKVDKGETEVIERVEVPLVRSLFEYVAPFKQARRREDDISIVTSGMRIRLRPEGSADDDGGGGGGGGTGEGRWTIEDVSIAFGGMAPVTKLARGAMSYMVGKTFGEETFVGARRALLKEFDMPDDVPGGQARYRMTLAAR